MANKLSINLGQRSAINLGTSLALTLPATFVTHAGIEHGDEFEVVMCGKDLCELLIRRVR